MVVFMVRVVLQCCFRCLQFPFVFPFLVQCDVQRSLRGGIDDASVLLDGIHHVSEHADACRQQQRVGPRLEGEGGGDSHAAYAEEDDEVGTHLHPPYEFAHAAHRHLHHSQRHTVVGAVEDVGDVEGVAEEDAERQHGEQWCLSEEQRHRPVADESYDVDGNVADGDAPCQVHGVEQRGVSPAEADACQVEVGGGECRCRRGPRESEHEDGVQLVADAEGHDPDGGADARHAVDGVFRVFMSSKEQVGAHHQIDDACYDERHLVNVLFHTAIQSVKVSC